MSVISKIEFLLGDDLLPEATAFESFFKKKLKKWGVNDPGEIPKAKRKKFFGEVDKEWKAKNEGISESTLQATMMQYGPYATAKKLGILSPKPSGPAGQIAAYPGTGYEYFRPDKKDDKIPGDKTDVKGYPGKHDVNYHPDKQDQKITGNKGDIVGFPGQHDAHYNPKKQDQKIAGNKGDVVGYPGKQDAHYDPKKQDQKISSKKDKGAVKSFPGTGQEHFDPAKADAKIPGDKTDVKGWDNAKVRHDVGVLGYTRDTRSDQTDPKPMTEMFDNPNKKIFEVYEKSVLKKDEDDLDAAQKKFGPKAYADKAGLVDKKKKKKKKEDEEKED